MWFLKVKRCCGFLAFLFMISYFSSAFAGVIRIPKDEPTIQAAINVSSYDDTILVEAGEYVEDIELKTGVQIIGDIPILKN